MLEIGGKERGQRDRVEVSGMYICGDMESHETRLVLLLYMDLNMEGWTFVYGGNVGSLKGELGM